MIEPNEGEDSWDEDEIEDQIIPKFHNSSQNFSMQKILKPVTSGEGNKE